MIGDERSATLGMISFCLWSCLLVLPTAGAETGIEAGRSAEDVELVRLLHRVEIPWQPWQGDSLEVDLDLELDIGYWHGEDETIWDVGATPVWRLQRRAGHGWFVEGAVGAYLLSDTYIGEQDLSSAYQFGDHVGFGWRSHGAQPLELRYRLQHLSNAGLVKPNNGIDFHLLSLVRHYN